jgi:hypothetical protein
LSDKVNIDEVILFAGDLKVIEDPIVIKGLIKNYIENSISTI